jgi:hypothetical protein
MRKENNEVAHFKRSEITLQYTNLEWGRFLAINE